MKTWIGTAWTEVVAIAIALVIFWPAMTEAASEPSRTTGASQPVPAASAQPQKPGGPVSRETTYSVKFINNGPAQITLDRTFDHCMYNAGPGSIYVDSYSSTTISLSDDNNLWQGCAEFLKAVLWRVHPTTEKGSTDPYDVLWSHEKIGVWLTDVVATPGKSNGMGLITSANCGGVPCLDVPVPAVDNSIEIYFDGSYKGEKQPAVITSPGYHSAIRANDPFYVHIVGTATPDTQVSVTTEDYPADKPWADDKGNWQTTAVYHFNSGQVYSATVVSDVEGSYTSTFISVAGVQIAGPSSPVPWSASIEINGYANPGATVVVMADRQHPGTPVCRGVANYAGNWSCSLSGLAAGFDYNITASQHGRVDDGGDGWSWVDPVLAQWPLHVDALPITFMYPPDNGHIDGDSSPFMAISGLGTPGGQVTINSTYSTVSPVYALINEHGAWKTDPVFHFPSASPKLQSYSVPVSQQVNGQDAPGATLDFDSWPSVQFTDPQDGTTLPSTQTSLVIKGTGVSGGTLTPDTPIPNDGATVCSSAPIDASGSWSCAVSNLTPAFYTLNMHQGTSGQQDLPLALHFSVARPVSIDEPVNEQAYPVQTTQVVFEGSGQPGASLKVSVPNATPCANQVIANSGQWSCLVSGLQVGGSYTATVTEGTSDAIAGGQGWVDPPVTRQFSVDGFSPLTIAVPTENQVFASATTSIMSTGQAQLGAQLRIDVPNAQPCQSQWVGPLLSQWKCEVSGLQPATSYLLTATQSVNGVDDVPKHVDFSVATPLVVLLPRENQQLGAAETTVDFSGTGQPAGYVSVTADPAEPCYTIADDKGRWRCTVTDLAAGTSYKAGVTQSGPGWQDPAVPRDFSVAAVQGIAIGRPRDKSTVSSNNPIDGIQVAGTGQTGAVAGVVVGSDTPRNVDIVNGAWATDPIPLSHYGVNGAALTIVATEYVDHNPQGQATANITVAKVATVTSPRDEEEVQDIGKVTVRGQGQEGARITVNIVDGAGPKKGCGATVSGGAWSCVLTGILPGSPYTLSVLQSGQAGDWTDQPVGRVFHTRAARPIAYGHPAPGEGLPADTPYDVTGTGEPDAQLSLKLMGVIDLGFTTVQGDGTWAFTNLLSSGPGCYSLTASQTLDGYPLDQGVTQYPVGGATCPGGSPFYIAQPMPDQVLVGSSYIIQGYGTPGYTVTFPNGPSCQTLVQRDGTWTCGPYPITAAGTYSVLAQQTQQPNVGSGDAPTSTRRFSILNPVAISSPADGSRSYWTDNKPPALFSVSGTATPDTLVEVSQTGGGIGDMQLVRASSTGVWSTAAVFQTAAPYPGGNCSIHACLSPPLTIHARQIYDGEVQGETTATITGEWDLVGQGSGQEQRSAHPPGSGR